MMRKIGTAVTPRPVERAETAKIERARKSARAGKNPRAAPGLSGVRPPPPGQGKRGEAGHLAYLLRQAQAASRLRWNGGWPDSA